MKSLPAVGMVLFALTVGVSVGTLLGSELAPASSAHRSGDGGEKPGKGAKGARKQAQAEKRAAHREFVAAKKAWAACVEDAAPAEGAEAEAFDPEAACGPKPRNPKAADPGRDKGERPPWAGGPGTRSEEPPGLAKKPEGKPGKPESPGKPEHAEKPDKPQKPAQPEAPAEPQGGAGNGADHGNSDGHGGGQGNDKGNGKGKQKQQG